MLMRFRASLIYPKFIPEVLALGVVGPRTSSMDVAWELVRNADSQARDLCLFFILTRALGGSWAGPEHPLKKPEGRTHI